MTRKLPRTAFVRIVGWTSSRRRGTIHRLRVTRPCYVADNHDRGANDTHVRWFDRPPNMHHSWDGSTMERAGKKEDFGQAELGEFETEQNRAKWMAETV